MERKECLKFDQQGKIIKPQFAIKRLFEKTKDKEVFISTEAGQHQTSMNILALMSQTDG